MTVTDRYHALLDSILKELEASRSHSNDATSDYFHSTVLMSRRVLSEFQKLLAKQSDPPLGKKVLNVLHQLEAEMLHLERRILADEQKISKQEELIDILRKEVEEGRHREFRAVNEKIMDAANYRHQGHQNTGLPVHKFRAQWEQDIEDNFGTIMPLIVFRVTWSTPDGKNHEFWSNSEEEALGKKFVIDHSEEGLRYINYEGWFAYRFDEHDRRFGYLPRDCEWW